MKVKLKKLNENVKLPVNFTTGKKSLYKVFSCSSNSKRSIKPNGYHQYKENGEVKSCWVGCSAKATNEYREKSMLVHCYNRYPHLTLIAFMQDCGYPLDERQFALAEMLQWVWRSRIRDGKPIKLAILSKRMREIFKDWLYND